jgi:AraC-like DNA-binding protein
MSNLATKPKVDVRHTDVYERLCRAREFIDLCYDLPLRLDDMSSKACFSRYHFLRLFRQAFDKTPHQYLVERRIEKAKELLRGPDLSVTSVQASSILTIARGPTKS